MTPPTDSGHAQEQAHRAQLARWCVMNKIPAPSGPVVDAFVQAMGANQYGVEETWDAYVWFKSGWEALQPMLLRVTETMETVYKGAKDRRHQDRVRVVSTAARALLVTSQKGSQD
jgi:hypothetical protein